MNQIRNFKINSILSIFMQMVFIAITKLVCDLLFPIQVPFSSFGGSLEFLITLFVVEVGISILSYGVLSMVLDNDISEENIDSPFLPLYFFRYTIPFIFGFMKGSMKILSVGNYQFIGQYIDGRLQLYYFDLFEVIKKDSFVFDGDSDDMNFLKKKLTNMVNEFTTKNTPTTPTFNFKEWDGTVDEESKRIKTIENIIK